MRYLLIWLFLLSMAGCIGDRRLHLVTPEEDKALREYRGNKVKEAPPVEKDWGFRWGWENNPSAFVEAKSVTDSITAPPPDTAFRIPKARTGAAYDFGTGQVRPVAGLELFEFKTPYAGKFSVSPGGGQDMGFLALEKKWDFLMGMGTGVFVGYDSKENTVTYGFSLLVVEF